MSYALTATSSQYFYNLTFATLSYPFTVIAMVKVQDTATNRATFSWVNGSSTTNRVYQWVGDDETVVAAFQSTSPSAEQYVGSNSVAVATNAWKLTHVRASSSTVRYNGHSTNEGSETTVPADAVTWDTYAPNRIYIGARDTTDYFMDGKIAWLAVYSALLSTDDIAALQNTLPSSHSSSYSNCIAFYDFRTNDANILKNQKNPGTYDLTASGSPTFDSDNPTLAVTKLKLLAHSSAASQSSIEGVVLNAARDTVIGEFTAQSFDASLVGTEAQLLVTATDISPNGSTLTTSDHPLAIAYNATYTTGLVTCDVVEV